MSFLQKVCEPLLLSARGEDPLHHNANPVLKAGGKAPAQPCPIAFRDVPYAPPHPTRSAFLLGSHDKAAEAPRFPESSALESLSSFLRQGRKLWFDARPYCKCFCTVGASE